MVGGRIAQIIHIMSWVGHGKLINGPITETNGTVVGWRKSELTVNILTENGKRTRPAVLSSAIFHSFIGQILTPYLYTVTT